MAVKISDLTLDPAPSLRNSYVETEREGASYRSPMNDFFLRPSIIKTDIDYTLALGDEQLVIRMSSSDPHTLTVPPNSSVAFPLGTMIAICRNGTGTVTVAAGAGVTIQASGTAPDAIVRHEVTWLWKISADAWKLSNRTNDLDLKANIASPAFTGTPTAPTAAPGTNTTQLATTAFVKAGLDLKADLASPAFTGTPSAPTASVGTNTTQIASTEFVIAELANTDFISQVKYTQALKSNIDYALTLGDQLNLIVMNSTSPHTLTVPLNATAPLAIGTLIPVLQFNTGAVTIAPEAGVTLENDTGGLTLKRHRLVWLWKRLTDTWRVFNNIPQADNTADADKPVSTAQQTALDLKANLASPAFTGTPTAPTAAPGTNTTQVATTAFVKAGLDLKADLTSPDFTGTPTASLSLALGNDSTRLATTAFVQGNLVLKADLASPAFSGNPTAPTQAAGNNTTRLATTAFVQTAVEAQIFDAEVVETGNRTLILADAWKCIFWNNISNTVTIPTNASVTYPLGTMIGLAVRGGGATVRTLTITPDTGVTLRGFRSLVTPSGGDNACFLVKVEANTWYAI